MNHVLLPAEMAEAPSFAAELDEALVAGTELPEPAQRWEIATLGQADWAMRKRAVLEARAAEVKSYAETLRQKADAWEQAELNRLKPSTEFFDGLLERYARARRDADPRDKTIVLPSGTVRTRAAKKHSVHVANEETVLAWARAVLDADEYGRVVKTTTKVLVPQLRDVVDVVHDPSRGTTRVVHCRTGEIVPGVFTMEPTVQVMVTPMIEGAEQ